MKLVPTASACLVLCWALGSVQAPSLAQTTQSPVSSLGNFSHIVANMDRSVEFYRDGLGLELSQPLRPFEANQTIMRLGNIMGAQTRYTALKVPGSTMAVELIEYQGIDRQPASPRFQDPGTGTLTVSVRDLDGTLARLKQHGGRVITVSGAPAEIGRSRIVFLQDPDGFIVELAQRIPSPAATPDAPGDVFGASFGGAPVVTIGGEPMNMGPLRIAVVRDPNNLFLELIQRP